MSEDERLGLFQQAITALTSWLDQSQTPYTLIGGIAVSLLSSPRATQDVDAVVWTDESKWSGLLESAASFGIAPRISGPIEFARRARVLLLRHEPSGVGLDISLGSLPFEREMIEHATLLSKSGIKARAPRVEDLIVTKIVARRPKDLADVESMLESSPSLDLNRIRKLAAEFADATDTPEILSDFESLLTRNQARKR